MNEIIQILIVASSIIPHELGHYIAFRIYGIDPKIEIKWFGIEIGSGSLHKVTLKQISVVALWGIYAGLLPLLYFNIDRYFIMIYLLMCMIDLSIVFNLFNNWKDRHKTYLEFSEYQLKEYKAKYMEER